MTSITVRPVGGWMTTYVLKPVLAGLKHIALVMFFIGKLVFEFFWWLASKMKNWPVVKAIDWMIIRLPLPALVGFYLFEIATTPLFAAYDTWLVYEIWEHLWQWACVFPLSMFLAIKLFKLFYYLVLTRIFALRCKEVLEHRWVKPILVFKDRMMGLVRETVWWQFLCRQSDYLKRRAKVWFRYFTRPKPFCRQAAA